MGLFDWLKSLFGGAPPPPRTARPIEAHGAPTRPAPLAAPARPVTPARPAAPAPAARRPEPPKPKSLNLDAAQFAPLADAEVRRQADQLGSPWSTGWFGRRDLIPPASDARTLLIDRAMVGHGLITPEELTRIHEVGEEMERVRPDLANAARLAEQAVVASDEERKRIREQKKAEAAERKQRHAEAVAHRRKTDIIFLGRGVSRGLADRRVNVEKLAAAGLPVLAAPADVAAALEISISRLRWLAYHSDASTVTHYVRFSVPKKSGGTRELAAPHRTLASAQEWIFGNILSKVAVHPAAHGFVRGRSTVSNATEHVGRHTVVNADLKDFFPTVTFPRVKGIFESLGYSPAAATVLALLCTESPRRVVTYAGRKFYVAAGPRALPQGACTSPALSNLASRRMDARLTGIATKLGWRYTRYADDLTFSGDAEPAKLTGYLLGRVRHIVRDEGFTVNEKKTRVLRACRAQSVTGIVVNDRPNVPRRTRRRMRAILHRAKREGLAAQNRHEHPYFTGWVRGMIAYISMVNPGQGQRLREALMFVGDEPPV